ncbi:MAG: glycosyltransferase [Rhizobacter sp.]|nr:glycosyltransferase [Rhizobacter sp.]
MSGRIAIVDPGSFVLPYDFHLVKALAANGRPVDFYGSTTRYNGEFLEAMRSLPSVQVVERAISSSVASRLGGALAYALQLGTVLLRAGRYGTVNLQFSGFWPLEWLVFALMRRKFVFTVHNAVPHGFSGTQHAPTRRLADLARELVFVSNATRDDFLRRYGERYRVKATVLPHGLLPVTPQDDVVPYAQLSQPKALVFWGRVQTYKGVEVFRALAKSDEVRRRGLALAVYGAWSPELHALQAELRHDGVALHEGYLDDAQLLALLAQDAVFLLPYQRASQSGVLYALLNHGRVFFCTDTGDLGAFMRRHGLEGLLLRDRTPEAVLACLDFLASNGDEVRQKLAAAQASLRWERLVAEAGQAYRV